MMKEIGGYFELELQPAANQLFDDQAVFVNSGRNAFEYIILSLPKINKLWMPYYTCSSLQEPIKRLGLHVCYYHVSKQLEIESLETLNIGKDDYLLYTNYFGVKNTYADYLQTVYPDNLILDNSQALFYPPSRLCFYSPRKFVGIPDGGVAYSPFKYEVKEQDKLSYMRCSHLLKRHDFPASEGYSDFKENSLTISNQPLRLMSNLTKKMLESIDFTQVREKRKLNFDWLHKRLGYMNSLLLNVGCSTSPLIYPFYSANESLRSYLINSRIYIATYWPNIFKHQELSEVEEHISVFIHPLPLDQRCTEDDLTLIVEKIKRLLT